MLSNVHNMAAQCPDWAVYEFAVRLLVDTQAFPSVFLIVKLQRSTVDRQDVVSARRMAQLLQLAIAVAFKKLTSPRRN